MSVDPQPSVHVLRFGGPVVQGTQGVSGLTLAVWLFLLLSGSWLAVKLWPLPVLAGWAWLVLGSFRLEVTPLTVTRRLGPFVLSLAWSELRRAQIQPLPGLGPVRLVLVGAQGSWISFPLFLLRRETQSQLAQLLLLYLPEELQIAWKRSS
ncbi:hypothetical protein [Anthocerotibacter panamensis]|uniref:hypothetical protein n=1 Tax=Anthocerotibacter panamensis TaxID=2857077 RepID=UPI001C407329|nr:hypothetical protein [Anthocerotibacter panamensis]